MTNVHFAQNQRRELSVINGDMSNKGSESACRTRRFGNDTRQ